MVSRVLRDFSGRGSTEIVVMSDEAHHCYREKPGSADEANLKGDDRKEAEKNRKAAREQTKG